jgi:hypothetical protein
LTDTAPESRAVAVAAQPQRRQITPVSDVVPIFDTADFEHMSRIANLMAAAPLVPKALKGNSPEEAMANCFLVVNQARNWRMDPFAVAQCCSVVQGKLMYEGKLIAAVIDSVLGIALDYEYYGEEGTPGRGVIVSATVDGKLKTIKGTVADWKTGNDNWKTQPDIQLVYRGSRVWCRVWKPAIMLGVYTFDEMEEAAELRQVSSADAGSSARRLSSGFGDEATIDGAAVRTDGVSRPASTPPHDPDTGEVIEGAADPKPKPRTRKKAEDPKPEPQGGEGPTFEQGAVDEDQGGAADTGQADQGQAESASQDDADRAQLDATLDGDNFPGDKATADTGDKAPAKEDAKPAAAKVDGPNPFARFEELLRETTSWLSIKQGLKVLKATDAWKEADEEAWRMTHRDVWERMLVLREEGHDRTDLVTDPSLFRCWLDSAQAEEHDVLQGTWKTVVRQPYYANMAEEVKEALAGAVQIRLQAAAAKGG